MLSVEKTLMCTSLSPLYWSVDNTPVLFPTCSLTLLQPSFCLTPSTLHALTTISGLNLKGFFGENQLKAFDLHSGLWIHEYDESFQTLILYLEIDFAFSDVFAFHIYMDISVNSVHSAVRTWFYGHELMYWRDLLKWANSSLQIIACY